VDKRKLKRAALIRFSSGLVVMGAMFFGLAGTLRFWEAWAFMAVLFIPASLVVLYFLRHDPEVLERRMKAKEERTQQKTIMTGFSVVSLGAFLIPGLDHRYGWSSVPTTVVVLADVLFLAGYIITFLTLRENRFASRTIRVEKDQTVITSGPYSIVRHPMYLGSTLMLLFAPLALGSYWAMIPTLTTPFFLALRTLDEEKLLVEELPGYRDYMKQTRYRVVPRVW